MASDLVSEQRRIFWKTLNISFCKWNENGLSLFSRIPPLRPPYPTNTQFLLNGVPQASQLLLGGVIWVELISRPHPLPKKPRESEKRTNQSTNLNGVTALSRFYQPRRVRGHLDGRNNIESIQITGGESTQRYTMKD